MTDEKQLLADLTQAAAPPPPKDFRPGVVYSGRMPSEITTDAIAPVETEEEWEAAVRAMGIYLPEGYGLALVEAVMAGSVDPAAWHRDIEDAKENRAHSAYTKAKTTQRWRYRFKVVLKDPRADADLATLMKEAAKVTRGRPLAPRTGGTMVINLSDFQAGKVDILGGTLELLQRSELAMAAKVAEVKRLRPAQIVLVDGGDSTEGFESSPNAERTNDLSQTEQIRFWRRVFWRWITTMAKLTEDLVVISVPSNHCSVRRGKRKLGPVDDDWGLEVLSQVADMAEVAGEAMAHVTFHVPQKHLEYVVLPLPCGKVFAAVHGHQVNLPNQIADYLKRNEAHGPGQADVVSVSHFHHLRQQAWGHGKFYVLNPTMDGGSAWYDSSGERSDPGICSYVIDENGLRDLHVAWAA